MSEVTRSHPPALRKTVKKTLLNECSLFKGAKILLGVSGGSDSMALMHVLDSLQKELDFSLYCVGINHNLRAEASQELVVAESFAKTMLIPFFTKSIFIKEGGNVQERARVLRYESIREIKQLIGADFISTAHHADDRAETVLMRIIRGTSVKGLDVLDPHNNDLLRPMVRAKKRDVMLHVERKNIPYCEDPSNKNTDKYLRSKIRYDILPELKKINPNVVDSLCELSNSAKNPELTGKRHCRKINL